MIKQIKILISLLGFGLFLIFSIQNNTLVDLNFLIFSIPQLPLYVIIVVVFIFGFMLGQTTSWFSHIFESKNDKKIKKSQ